MESSAEELSAEEVTAAECLAAEGVGMEVLDEEVHEVLENFIEKKSKDVYLYGISRYVVWLHSNKAILLNPDLQAQLSATDGSTQIKNAAVRRFMLSHPSTPPVNVEGATSKDFQRFLMSLRKVNGERPGKSVYSSPRSSLFHLYRLYGVTMPVEFVADMKLFFKGLKRTVIKRLSENGQRLTEGKEPLGFSMYQLICKSMRHQPRKEYIFAHTFLVLSWNLMCRAGNSVLIRYQHLEWHQDALAIRFAHMKNDQEGERPRDARHVYANPLMPDICPVLSMAVYLTVFGFDSSSLLFPGNNQYDRYAKILKRTLSLPEVADTLSGSGLHASDFGSHSARKGSATFVSSCSTAGPSSASICLRAGWSLPGVQDTYVRYEAAGDMVVGRFVAGLPFESPNFAILPPFFETLDDTVKNGVEMCFPAAPQVMKPACAFLLASLVYHSDHLKTNLDPLHLIFSSPIFRDLDLLAALRQRVSCCCSRENLSIRPTGIPPHIGILMAMKRQSDQLTEVVTTLKGIGPALAEQINETLDNRQADTGLAIRSSINEAIRAAINETGLTEFLQSARSVLQSHTGDSNDPAPTAPPTIQVFTYNGGLHRVPLDFVFPKGTIANAWELWWFGNLAKRYPPIRNLAPADMPDKNKRKRLSDYRFLMTRIESEVIRSGAFVESPSLDEARAMLHSAIQSLHILPHTTRNRTRRKEQLQWSTAVNILRKNDKVSRGSTS